MKKLINTKNMSRDEWLAWRNMGIGGSDAATILGLNPYGTPFGLYLEKRGEIEAEEAGEAAYWGTQLEEILAQEFKKRNPDFRVQRNNFLLQHEEYPFMIGNIDRELYHPEKGRGILEVKTASAFLNKEWEGDSAPPKYIIQTQHYMAVTGYEYAYFVVLIGGQRYHQILVERDQEIIDYLYEAEGEFWERVKNGQAPDLSEAEAESAILKRLYPEAVHAEPLPLESTAEQLAEQRIQLKEQEKELKKQIESIENRLKHMIGEYESGIINDTQIFYKNVTQRRVDSQALKNNYPDIYQKVIKINQYRKLDIKKAR